MLNFKLWLETHVIIKDISEIKKDILKLLKEIESKINKDYRAQHSINELRTIIKEDRLDYYNFADHFLHGILYNLPKTKEFNEIRRKFHKIQYSFLIYTDQENASNLGEIALKTDRIDTDHDILNNDYITDRNYENHSKPLELSHGSIISQNRLNKVNHDRKTKYLFMKLYNIVKKELLDRESINLLNNLKHEDFYDYTTWLAILDKLEEKGLDTSKYRDFIEYALNYEKHTSFKNITSVNGYEKTWNYLPQEGEF